MRPTIDATLIGELRAMVVRHNEANPNARVKLGELKKLYERSWRGPNPGQRAMAKIEEHLELTKAGEFEEGKHRRAKDGEFSSTGATVASMPRATNERDHQQLQSKDPTYRAMTTAIIPETRFQGYGIMLRNAVALGVAGAGVASLARGRPNGIGAKAAAYVGGKVGLAIAAIPAAMVGYGVTAAAQGVRAATKKAAAPASYTWAKGLTAGAAKAGTKAGAAVGAASHTVSSKAMGATLSLGNHSKPKVAWARKAGILAGLTGAGAYGINNRIAGSVVDPEPVGEAYDKISYRTVQKSVQTEEIGQARDKMVLELRKRLDENPLQKAGLIQGVSRYVLPGLAAAGGAAIAGAATHFGQRAIAQSANGKKEGNPYHDNHGRFTSRSSAITAGGALAGAALGAGAALLAVRSHNARYTTRVVQRVAQMVGTRLARVHPETLTRALGSEAGADTAKAALHPRLQAAINQREARVAHLMETSGHPMAQQHRAAVDHLANYGASHPTIYHQHAQDFWSNRLADQAQLLNHFTVPHGNRERTVADMVRSGMSHQDIHAELSSSIRRMTEPGHLDAALRQVEQHNPEAAAAFRQMHADREHVGPAVEAALAEHASKAERANAVVQGHIESISQAERELHVANRRVEEAPTDMKGRKPLERAAATAQKKLDVALGHHTTAQGHLDNLIERGPDVVLPGGTRIPAAPLLAHNAHIDALETRAREVVTGHVNDEIQALRATMEAGERDRGAQLAIASARLIHRGGAAPSELRDAIGALVAHHSTPVPGGRGLARRQAAHSARARELGDAVFTAARGLGQRPPSSGSVQMQRLRADLGRVAQGASAPLKALINNPVASKLKSWADVVYQPVSHAAAATWGGAKAMATGTVDRTLMTTSKVPDAASPTGFKDVWHPDPYKAAAWIGAGGLAALGTAAHDIKDYATDRAKRFSGDKSIKPEFKHLKLETSEIDPNTGNHATALTVTDPKNKNERLVLMGHRAVRDGDNGALKRRPVASGSRWSAVKNSVKAGPNNSGGGGNDSSAPGMAGETVGKVNGAIKQMREKNKLEGIQAGDAGQVQMRHPSATEWQSQGEEVAKHARSHLNNNNAKDALSTVLSHQGKALTFKQASELLTGYNNGGDDKGKGIFKADGFKSTDKSDTVEALGSLIDNAKGQHSKNVLHKVVAIVGKSRNLEHSDVSALHDKIKGVEASQPAQEEIGPSPKPAMRQAVDHVGQGIKNALKNPQYAAMEPHEWAEAALGHATNRAKDIVKKAGLAEEHAGPIADSLSAMAEIVRHTAAQSSHKLTLGPHNSVNMAIRAIKGGGGDTPDDWKEHVKRIIDPAAGLEHFNTHLGTQMERASTQPAEHLLKGAHLDSLNKLLKLDMSAFEESLHPRGPRGMFTDKGGAGNLASRVVSEGVEQVGTAVSRAHASRPASQLDPVNVGGNIGNAVGYNLGFNAASAGAKSVINTAVNAVSAALPAPIGLAARGVGALVGIGAGMLGGQAVASGTKAAGEAAGTAIHAVRGTAAPAQSSMPESIGSTLGSIAASYGGGHVSERMLGDKIGGYVARQGVKLAATDTIKTLATFAADKAAGAGIGRIAGSALGGVLGTLAEPGLGTVAGEVIGNSVGAAVGDYAGGLAGHAIGRWFSGYNKEATSRVAARHTGMVRPRDMSALRAATQQPQV